MVLSCMIRTNQRFGKQMIAQVLTGSKIRKSLNLIFILCQLTDFYQIVVKEVSEFIEFLISDELIAVEHGILPDTQK